jgi:septum formation protein
VPASSPLWLPQEPLVLASQSAARASLLASAAIPFMAVPAAIDEREVEAAAAPAGAEGAAVLLAERKALDRSCALPGRLVLGADQTLELDGRRFSKPADRPAARAQLLALRGRTHSLHSGLALARDGALLWSGADTAEMTMRDFSESFLDLYLDAAGADVLKSVGAYRLEGPGIHLFERVRGAHSTVLGLPLLLLLARLRDIGALAA